MARAIKFYTDNEVVGYDIDPDSVKKAVLVGAVDEVLTDFSKISECDVVLIATYPSPSIDFINQHAAKIKHDALVIDLGGIKRNICKAGFAAADKYSFHFIGGHPMAGTQFSGFTYSKENLFRGATMVLVPKAGEDIKVLEHAKQLFDKIGFDAVNFTNADAHDEIIAYTSQLAHILSNAYVKSPTAQRHRGFSAGSFRDLTRVAHLNEDMWTELFMENRDNLIPEVDRLIHYLTEYSDALKAEDSEKLKQLLRDGKLKKLETERQNS